MIYHKIFIKYSKMIMINKIKKISKDYKVITMLILMIKVIYSRKNNIHLKILIVYKINNQVFYHKYLQSHFQFHIHKHLILLSLHLLHLNSHLQYYNNLHIINSHYLNHLLLLLFHFIYKRISNWILQNKIKYNKMKLVIWIIQWIIKIYNQLENK